MSEAQELEQLRNQIDGLDQQIQQLINERARRAQQVAEVKHKYAKPGETVVFYRPNAKRKCCAKSWSATKVCCQKKPWPKFFVKLCRSAWLWKSLCNWRI